MSSEKGSVAENEAKMDEHLQKLRELVLKSTKINSCMDDEFLIRFIRAKKYDIELAAKQVKKYWVLRASIPELLENAFPTNFRGMFETLFSVYKNRSEGRHIVFIRFGQWDPNAIPFDSLVSMFIILIDHLVSYEQTQLNGVMFLEDWEGLNLNQIIHVTPRRVHQVLKFVQGSYPIRIKGFHIMNNPTVAQVLMAMIYPFMSTKMRNRFVMHGHKYEDSIQKVFGADSLPQHLGGNIPDHECEDTNFFESLYLKDSYYRGLLSYGVTT